MSVTTENLMETHIYENTHLTAGVTCLILVYLYLKLSFILSSRAVFLHLNVVINIWEPL